MRIESTRVKLLLVAIAIAVGREVAAHFGIEIPLETFATIEGLLLSVMGLDTVRPLGKGYPPEPASVADPAAPEA